MKKIVFIAKTDLNKDGRILNELRILKNKFKNKIFIEFILMADKPLNIVIEDVDRFHFISTRIRNNSLLRIFTVFEFTVKALIKLFRTKPDVIHAEDTAITLPVYLYSLLKGKNVVIVYDDHELPNENETIQLKFLQKVETLLMARSAHIIFANKERQDYLTNVSNLNLSNSSYLLNLPYFENVNNALSSEVIPIYQFKEENQLKFIMHQGIIEEERGRLKLADFSKKLPKHVKILIVGVSKKYFEEFIEEYNLDEFNFHFIGAVPYYVLNDYWKLADASIVMYLPKYLNNKLCAPNRLYISYNHRLPIIVNIDNPVLSNFVKTNNCGLFIEDLTTLNIEDIFSIKYNSDSIEQLKQSEMGKLEGLYEKIIK